MTRPAPDDKRKLWEWSIWKLVNGEEIPIASGTEASEEVANLQASSMGRQMANKTHCLCAVRVRCLYRPAEEQ